MYLVIFPFGFEGRMWDLVVSVPDRCLSFYFTTVNNTDSTIKFSVATVKINVATVLSLLTFLVHHTSYCRVII